MRLLLIGLSTVAVLGLGIAKTEYIYNPEKHIKITATKPQEPIKNQRRNFLVDPLLVVNSKLLAKHMFRNYKDVSAAKKKVILQAIFKSAQKYNINPLILYSIADIESDMRFWIKHANVYVNITKNGKKRRIKTAAIGLCGVIWEIWEERLKKHKIAEVKSDLYDPVVNIEAAAYIIDYNRKLPIVKGAKSKIESALLRYYGVIPGQKNEYFNKVKNVVFSIVYSELFGTGKKVGT